MPPTESNGVTVTPAVAKVLHAFLDDPTAERYGFELMQTTGLASGSLYPILARLEAAEWVASEKEPINPAKTGRPARRYYRITAEGILQGADALAAMRNAFRAPQPNSTLKQLRDARRRLRPSGGTA